MTSPSYRIVPINNSYIHRTRQGEDALGQVPERLIAKGGEPLRDVLRRALPGESIFLASYSPFKLAGPYREFGPIFISAELAPPMSLPPRLPCGEQASYFGKSFVLRAYCKNERIVDAVLASDRDAEDHIERFFARENVDFVLARFAAYGCFGCRLERIRTE